MSDDVASVPVPSALDDDGVSRLKPKKRPRFNSKSVDFDSNRNGVDNDTIKSMHSLHSIAGSNAIQTVAEEVESPTTPEIPSFPTMIKGGNASQSVTTMRVSITKNGEPVLESNATASLSRSKSEPHAIGKRPSHKKRDSQHAFGERDQSVALSMKIVTSNTIKRMKNGLNQFKSATTAQEMIQNLVVEKDGKQMIDQTILDFDYLESRMKDIALTQWGQWIYDNFIGSKADYQVNLSYANKMRIDEYFARDTKREGTVMSKDEPELVKGRSNSSAVELVSDKENVDIFDDAQKEVWKLMANDSLAHFKRTNKYKQVRSFLFPDTARHSE